MYKRIIFLIFILICSIRTFGQIPSKREVGIRGLYGIYCQTLPEKDIYRPVVFAPYYNYYLGKKNKRGKFSLYAEPQLTFVFLKYPRTDKFEHEIGINGGITYSYWFNWFSLYVGLGSGPNFISVTTRKQANGFIFSDNVFWGVKRAIANSYYLDFQIRARHISNAGLKNPNRGINNIFTGVGLSKFF